MDRSGTTIVINATNIGSTIDGIGVYSLNLLREIIRQKPSRRIIVYVNKSCREHLKGFTFSGRCELRWVSSWVSPDRRFVGHLLRLLYSNYLALKHRTALFVVTSQIEAVFVHTNALITIHDVIPLLFKQLHRKQYYYFKYLLGFAMNRARGLITPSHHTKAMLETHYGIPPHRIRVIHNGGGNGELGFSVRCESPEEKYILYAGRVVDIKNIDGVIQGFSEVARHVPHKLVIVGEGRASGFTGHGAGRSFELRDRVIFKGYVSSEELSELLRKASLFVFPSFYEGFGLPPLEAMARGCPVVTSGVSSLPEVCGDAAFYVDPCSVHSIAAGIHKVLTNDELRTTLITKGYERARLFTWKKSAREHFKLFNDLVGGSGMRKPIPHTPRRTEVFGEAHAISPGVS